MHKSLLKYHFEFKKLHCLQVDGADRCDLKVKSIELDNLTEEGALHMVLEEKSVAKWVTTGIARTKYLIYPGCRAILHIFTNRHVTKPKLQDKNDVKEN